MRKLLLTKFRYVPRRLLLFFGTYNASSALTFAKSRQCLRMSVQCVEKHLNPDPNWPSTAFRRMRRRNVTNVEICSKKQTLQGILRFIQAEVCWHVKNVERLSTERTVFANMWTDSMKKLQSTNVVTARKLFLKNGTYVLSRISLSLSQWPEIMETAFSLHE